MRNTKVLWSDLTKIEPKDLRGVDVVASPTTGLDHISLDYCKKKGIEVISLRGENEFLRTIPATAEHTMGLILALMRKIPWAYNDALGGFWERQNFVGRELKGKRILIVGYGRVGKMVAGYANAFGMAIDYIDKKDKELHNKLREADIVTLHLHLEGNEGYFDRKCFKNMKKGAWFINTSRGRIIDENALLEFLGNGHLAGGALDVVWDEPNIREELIDYALEHDNLLITPHIGGATKESMEKTQKLIEQKVAEYIKNKKHGI